MIPVPLPCLGVGFYISINIVIRFFVADDVFVVVALPNFCFNIEIIILNIFFASFKTKGFK